MRVFICMLISLWAPPVLLKDINEIVQEKIRLFELEQQMMLGSDIVLSDNEEKANDIIMHLKMKEIDEGYIYPQFYNLSKHFFDYKDDVKQTELFQIIKAMPKGAILHAHDTGILGPDYMLNLTYWDDLYVCFHSDGVLFLFSDQLPQTPCPTQWQLMRDARYSSGNVEKFDADLRKHFTIVIDNPNEVYTDVNAAWITFQNYFITTSPIVYYKPIWEQYFYDTLKALREDNVMYIEIRSVLGSLYDLQGNTYDTLTTAESYKKVLDQFLKDYPDFYGAKLIYAPLRRTSIEEVERYIEKARELKRNLPGFFAGFDLVGQEDLGAPLSDFLPVLSEAADEFSYFFHAGETNWFGFPSDENIFDAIVLGSKRLGHAYAITKHPVLLDEVIRRDIGLEVNVVSNAVLALVSDVRNHPLASLLAQNAPVVLSCDDPGVWEAEPLTHDFYVAFVGVAGRRADLRVLKKLALNSLIYSSIENKDRVLFDFEMRWTQFINNLISEYTLV